MLGLVPTPAVPYLVGQIQGRRGRDDLRLAQSGAEFNGIKIFSRRRRASCPTSWRSASRTIALGRETTPRLTRRRRKPSARSTYPSEQPVKDYVDHLKSAPSPTSLAGMSTSPSTAPTARPVGDRPQRCSTIWARTARMLCDQPDGLNINDGCGSTHLERPASAVRAASRGWTSAWPSTATPTAA